jgi:hypothetical protein
MTVHDIGDAIRKEFPEVSWATVSLTARRIWRDYRGKDIPAHKLDELVEAVLTEVKAKRDEDEKLKAKGEAERKAGIAWVPANPKAYEVDWNSTTPEQR